MKLSNTSWAIAIAIALLGFPAFAQQTPNLPEFKNLFGNEGDASLFTLKTDFPSSPAFAVLDEDPAPLQNIRNFEDLGAQILSGVDANGTLIGEGLSFGGRPFWWGDRSELTLTDYNNGSWWDRLYQRSHFSVATIKTEAPQPGSSDLWRVGVAITTELLDRQDIRVFDKGDTDKNGLINSFTSCIANKGAAFITIVNGARREALQQALGVIEKKYSRLNFTEAKALADEAEVRGKVAEIAGDQAEQVNSDLENAFDKSLADLTKTVVQANEGIAKKAHEECVAERAKTLQGRESIRVGIAHALTSTTGKADDFEGEALSVWISARKPMPSFIKGSMLTGFLQYDTDRLLKYETAGAPANAVVDGLAKGDRMQANLGLATTSDDLTLAASASYVDINFNNSALMDDDYTLISISASKRLKPGMWLEFSLGSSDSDRLSEDEFVNLRLKFDWSQLGK